jgi:hypothetical protein
VPVEIETRPVVIPELPVVEERGSSTVTAEQPRESLGEAIRSVQGTPFIRAPENGPVESVTASEAVPESAAPTATKATASVGSLPPLGVLWAPLEYRGSGASGIGIGGTDADAQSEIRIKFGYYTEPAKYGVGENQESRLFRDAVAKGYVENTPAGLGALLTYLGKGSVGADPRPPLITAYFNHFYAGERAAGR